MDDKDVDHSHDIIPDHQKHGGWNSDDETDAEDAQESLDLALKLQAAIPIFFPPTEAVLEPTTLFHADLNTTNMLITDSGQLSAILDWECVTAVPRWRACQLPEFLIGRPRDRALTPRAPQIMPTGLSAEQAATWSEEQGWQVTFHEEWAWQWDQTRLREVFKQEMRRIDPEWMRVYDVSVKERDFDVAVRNCGEELYRRRTRLWLENSLSGKPYKRIEMIFEEEEEHGD